MNIEKSATASQRTGFFPIAVIAAVLLLIPFIAMQFTDEVNWSIADFVVMFFLLFSMARLFVLISQKTQRRYRPVIGITLAIAFLYIWAELAVGIFTWFGS